MRSIGYLLFVFFMNMFLVVGQDGSIDATFNTLDQGFGLGDGAVGRVDVCRVLPDGKVILAGKVRSYNGQPTGGMVRLNVNGTVDNSLQTFFTNNDTIFTFTVLSDGKILVGGSFNSYNNVSVRNFIRLNPNGTLDTTFDPTALISGLGNIIELNDGKVLVSASYVVEGVPQGWSVLRFNIDGSLDQSFEITSAATGVIKNMVVMPDGKIVVSGSFETFGGNPSKGIVRLNPNGGNDPTFQIGEGFNVSPEELFALPNGKLLASGNFSTYKGTAVNDIIRINANGNLDANFVSNTDYIRPRGKIGLLSNGKIVGEIGFQNEFGTNSSKIVLLNPDGSLDTAFDSKPTEGLRFFSGSIDTNDRIIVLSDGGFSSFSGSATKVKRLSSKGAVDAAYGISGTGVDGRVTKIETKPNGDIILCGEFKNYNNVPVNGFIVLKPDGVINTAFNMGTGPDEQVTDFVQLPNGKILIGGKFNSYNGIQSKKLALLNANGSLDTSFSSGMTSSIFSDDIENLALQPDGKIIIQGKFSEYGGVSKNDMARINPDGSLDPTFDVGLGIEESNPNLGLINEILIRSNGKIIVAGAFDKFNGITRNCLVQLNPDGSVDSSFVSNVTEFGSKPKVLTAQLQKDGKILIGGAFSVYNGTPRKRIARINVDGTLDNSFDPQGGASTSFVETLHVLESEKILIGGSFNKYNNIPVNYFARLNADGSLDTTFDTTNGPNNFVFSVYPQKGKGILLGGFFTSYDEVGRNRLARVKSADQLLSTPDFTTRDQLKISVKDGLLMIENRKGIKRVQFYDISGKMIFQKNEINNNSFKMELISNSEQLYLLQILDISNRLFTQKVVF